MTPGAGGAYIGDMIRWILLMSWAGVACAAAQPFRVGEEMTFEIRALGVNAAWQRVKVEALEEVGGRKAWKITSVLRTFPAVDVVYKMRDDSTTWLDAETSQVLRVVSRQEEGGWRNEAFITNDPTEAVVRYHDRRGSRRMAYEPPVLDLIGMIYYGRTLDLAVGRQYGFGIIDGPKILRVSARVTRRETRRTSPGYHPDPRVPLLMLERMDDPSRVAVWFTDDQRKVPVRIRTMPIELVGIKLGNIESVLVKYKEE